MLVSFPSLWAHICHPIVFIRKEHKAHSPQCDFVALKKPVEELTVEEFLKLQKERQKFQIVSRYQFEVLKCSLLEIRI